MCALMHELRSLRIILVEFFCSLEFNRFASDRGRPFLPASARPRHWSPVTGNFFSSANLSLVSSRLTGERSQMRYFLVKALATESGFISSAI
jgi:hypothetical protein